MVIGHKRIAVHKLLIAAKEGIDIGAVEEAGYIIKVINNQLAATVMMDNSFIIIMVKAGKLI